MALLQHDWPYNVRELESVVRRCAALVPKGTEIDVKHLPDELRDPARSAAVGAGRNPTPSGPEIADSSEASRHRPSPTKEELLAALERHKGRIAAVARDFKRDRTQIRRWMNQYDIDPDAFRPE